MYKGPFPVNDRSGTMSDYQPNLGTTSIYRNYWVSQLTGSFSSVKTPGFRALKSKRGLPHNNFSHFLRDERYGVSEERNASRVLTGYFMGPSSIDGSLLKEADTASANIKARGKIFDKLKDSSINLGQAYAERRQTANLVSTSINRVASAALAIRRGNFKHAVDLFGRKTKGSDLLRDLKPTKDNLASYWLEFQYGWKPLISDIYGACELIAKTYHGNHPTIVKSNVESQANFSNYPIGFYSNGYNNSSLMCSSTCRTRVSYAIELIEDGPVLQKMAATGITNPALLAWELLPYSFVLDWFVPVGSYLSSLDASAGLSFIRGSRTGLSHSVHTANWIVGDVWEASPSRLISLSPYRIEIFNKSRQVLVDFPTPSLPRFDPSLGVSHALSGLALLNQLFRK